MTIIPGATLGSDLACSDDLPVLSSALAWDAGGLTYASALSCSDDPNVLTIGSDQSCGGPPVFFKIATRSSGRFFLI